MMQESVTRDSESICDAKERERKRRDKEKNEAVATKSSIIITQFALYPHSTPRPTSGRVVSTTLGASTSSGAIDAAATTGPIPIAAWAEKLWVEHPGVEPTSAHSAQPTEPAAGAETTEAA